MTGPGDQINTEPLLGPLQDNGGPTLTHALLPGSPAIDAGDPNFTPPPFYDQRGPGFPRVVNGRIDVGSFEVQGPTPTPTPTATPCASVGSWAEQSPYPIVTSGQAVASVGGNIYSFGGIVNNVAIANAYKYTPATNTWTPIASLPAPRGWFSAASDGTYIYLLGGVDQNFTTTATLWRYDPVSNTYNTSLPSYTIPTYFHASAYLNGKIYRIAGRAIGTDFHVEVYTIATNTWSLAANYPFANHSLMAVALGNYIYAGGGNASPDKTWRYDPSTDTWDDAAVADLPAGRSAAASGAYNGRWLLAGGDVNFAISTSAIAWDPATNTWNNLPNMVQARDYLGGATAGQSFYAVAGNSAPGTPTNDNQQYTETCATSTPTPTATSANADSDCYRNSNSYSDADTYGDGNTDRDGDSNSYTYFDTETFTDAESSRRRRGRVLRHSHARSPRRLRSIAPTLARGRCGSGLRRTFPCSRPSRCENDRAFRRSDPELRTCRIPSASAREKRRRFR